MCFAHSGTAGESLHVQAGISESAAAAFARPAHNDLLEIGRHR